MIPTPFRFEPELSDQEFQKLGQLSLRWSHIEHIIGNCLKVMLRLSDAEAVFMVFSLSLDQRISRINQIAGINPLKPEAAAILEELNPILRGVQYVRNSVIHAIIVEDDQEGHTFHLRSKMRTLTKTQIFSCEELTNYAGHLVVAFRYALGFKENPQGHTYALPERPLLPEFLQSLVQFPKAPKTQAG